MAKIVREEETGKVRIYIRNHLGQLQNLLGGNGGKLDFSDEADELAHIATCASTMEPHDPAYLIKLRNREKRPPALRMGLAGGLDSDDRREPTLATTPIHKDGSPITRESCGTRQEQEGIRRGHHRRSQTGSSRYSYGQSPYGYSFYDAGPQHGPGPMPGWNPRHGDPGLGPGAAYRDHDGWFGHGAAGGPSFEDAKSHMPGPPPDLSAHMQAEARISERMRREAGMAPEPDPSSPRPHWDARDALNRFRERMARKRESTQ